MRSILEARQCAAFFGGRFRAQTEPNVHTQGRRRRRQMSRFKRTCKQREGGETSARLLVLVNGVGANSNRQAPPPPASPSQLSIKLMTRGQNDDSMKKNNSLQPSVTSTHTHGRGGQRLKSQRSRVTLRCQQRLAALRLSLALTGRREVSRVRAYCSLSSFTLNAWVRSCPTHTHTHGQHDVFFCCHVKVMQRCQAVTETGGPFGGDKRPRT